MIESFSRMWDQPAKQGSEMLAQRIIPTYVGSTPAAPSCHGGSSNHSHVCGINRNAPARELIHPESFPRMWDQLDLLLCRQSCERIIPTYVGSTMHTALPSETSIESFPRMWDQRKTKDEIHVRLRIIPTYVGSTLEHQTLANKLIESFPRMWDQQFLLTHRAMHKRIIPTYVGSTVHRPACTRDRANHSHVCGINSSKVSGYCFVGESFPRMWDQR